MNWGEYLPDPPEMEEPSDDEYCAMSGHESYFEDRHGMGLLCYCGMVIHRGKDDPYDEYSAYCADLIDLYVKEVEKNNYRTSYDLRFEMGRALRYKSPDYLLSLIASAKNSGPQTTEGWTTLDEDTMDFFEKLGFHLSYSGLAVISSVIHSLSGASGYKPVDSTGKPDAHGVLDRGNNLEIVQNATRLYVNLIPVGRGNYWQHQAEKAIIPLLPALERPDIIDGIAALLNREGYSPATIERALAMAEEETVAVNLVEGFL